MKKLALILLLVLTAIPCFAFSTTTAFAEDGKHTVSFYVDGELHEQYLVSDGGFSDIPVTPVKDGEIFIEWQENGSTFYFYNPITEDKTINAVFESLAVVYTVDFVVDGNIVNTQKVLEGQTVIAPTSVELPEGKILVGWENSDDLQTVNSNMTVNAILADKEYTVTIYGLDDIVVDEITVVHGENAILPNYADYSTEYYTATGYSSTPT
ncbi:MAG: InlB B-repeat-containing protein, partial [Clostridia bacterium]|nr:InlB B-repeat-containing protein [Clostridia bacterium]